MQFGYFAMPSHPPERPLKDGHEWDLQVLRWLDEFGFAEAWIGEHHTAPWEPHPSPDLLIAQALMETRHIRLAPGGFLLPYHHPAELANRVAMLDHMAQGRLNFGVAASGLPSDWAMFNVDGNAGQHREMTREALDIILKLWTAEEPFDYDGKYWKVTKTDLMLRTLRPHIRPLQKPYPPIGVAGVSKGSETLKLAGEHGFLPMSLNLNPGYVASHWESVEEGARRTGRSPRRADWRLVREIFIADSRSLAAVRRRNDGPNDAGIFPAAADRCGRHPILEARPRCRRWRCHPGVLRASQLADRVAGDRRREDRADVRGGRRLWRDSPVLLRLQRRP